MVEQVFVKGFVNGEFPYSAEVWHLSILEKSLALRKVSGMCTNSWSSNGYVMTASVSNYPIYGCISG
jgi:hypothetical protein